MAAFLIVIFILISGFTATAMFRQSRYIEPRKIHNEWLIQWRVMFGDFGDFNTEEFDSFDWILFVIMTFIMPLVLMNLLIAILSESYENSKGQIKKRQAATLNDIISELEIYYIKTQKKTEPSYLVFAEYESKAMKEEEKEPSEYELKFQ